MDGKKEWAETASELDVRKTIDALKNNGISAELVANREEAKKKVLSLIPEGAELMEMTSTTLDSIGLSKEIQSGKYNLVKDKLKLMDRNTRHMEMQKLGSAPEYALGSVNAVTEDGKIIIVSNTGSQLPAYAYGSKKVIWVVGTNKIEKNLDEAMKRINEYTLKLESERAKKVYGVPGSLVGKVLIINKETNPERIHLIFVNESLGF